MRHLVVLVVCGSLVVPACGGGSESPAAPDTETPATAPVVVTPPPGTVTPTVTPTGAPTTEPTTAPTTVAPTTAPPTNAPSPTEPAGTAVRELAPETPGERAALERAASPEGRRWAAGDAFGTAEARGRPFLVGYEVLLDDGVTEHQQMVLDGVVVPNFSTEFGVPVISGPVTGGMTLAPETPRQRAAVRAAREALEAIGIDAPHGGILSYRIYFPPTGTSSIGTDHPSVGVRAVEDPLAPFTSGGTEIR